MRPTVISLFLQILRIASVFSLLWLPVSATAQFTAYTDAARSKFNKLERVGDALFARDGIAAVLVEGDVLYFAANTSGFFAYDIKDRFKPVQLGFTKDISLPTNGIAKKGNYIYVSDNTNGIDVFDVSDPTKPSLAGSFQTNSKEAYDLCMDDGKNFLFVATGKAGIETWSLSNPAKPQRVGETGTSIPFTYAWGISFHSGRLFVGDREGGLRILDASNPQSLQLVSNYRSLVNTVRYAIAKDTLVFVANAANGFEVVNIKNINQPKRVFSYNFRNYVGGLAFYPIDPRYFFVGAGKGGLTVYDLKKMFAAGDDADEPTEKTDKGVGELGRMAIADHAVYVATNSNGLLIYTFNLTPLLTNVKNLTVDENQTLSYTFEGKDPDGDKDIISLSSSSGKYPDSLIYNSTSRTLTWKPSFTQSGVYDFTVRIKELTPDSLVSELPMKITVAHVNRAPTLPELKAQLTLENKELKVVIPEGTDPDAEDNGKLTYAADSLPRGAQFDPKTRTLTWTPDYTQAGDYRVLFTVLDANTDGRGAKTDSKFMSIRVDNVNLPPAFTRLEKQTFTEDTDGSFEIAATDPDKEDDGKLTYKQLSLPKGATFDPATRKFTWKPDFTQAGEYSAKFEVLDQGLDTKFAPSTKLLRDTMTVAITVKQKNRPPVFAPIAAKTVKENAQLSFTVSASDPDNEDRDKLVYAADSLPRGAQFDPKTRTFSWKPDFDQSGDYTVVFKATDTGIDGTPLTATERAAITVSGLNRPPKLDAIAEAKGNEDALLTFEIKATDPDVEDSTRLKISADNLPEGAKFDGKTFSWKPTFEQSGTYRVTYTVVDGDGLKDTKTGVLTIANVNRAPKLAKAENATVIEKSKVSFKISATDDDKEDKGKLVFDAQNLPTGAQFDRATQTFTWTPDFGQRGTYGILFRVKDSFGAEDTLTAFVTVTRLNRKPKLDKPKDVVVKIGEPLNLSLTASDEDKEDKLTFSATGLPQGATLSPDGKLTFTPTEANSGSFSVQVTVKDDMDGSDAQAFTIRVPYRPKFERIAAVQAKEKEKISFKVVANDEDKEDKGKLVYEASSLPTGASYDRNTFSWTPDFGQRGSYTVQFKVKDTFGAEDTMSVGISVARLNRKPKLDKPRDATAKVGEPLDIQLTASDEDKEDKLTFSATGLPQGATLSPDGKLTFTPTEATVGKFTVQVSVKDDQGGDDSKSFSITVPKPAKSDK